jgi:hypothetical protein
MHAPRDGAREAKEQPAGHRTLATITPPAIERKQRAIRSANRISKPRRTGRDEQAG